MRGWCPEPTLYPLSYGASDPSGAPGRPPVAWDPWAGGQRVRRSPWGAIVEGVGSGAALRDPPGRRRPARNATPKVPREPRSPGPPRRPRASRRCATTGEHYSRLHRLRRGAPDSRLPQASTTPALTGAQSWALTAVSSRHGWNMFDRRDALTARALRIVAAATAPPIAHTAALSRSAVP